MGQSLEQHNRLNEARPLFAQSEKILNLLRTQAAAALPKATDEEILQWREKLKDKVRSQ
jgi:hypothetical protein